MKFKKPSFKFKFKITKRVIQYGVGIVMFAAVIYVGFFLYQNFYRVITYSDEIIVLRQEVVSERLQIKKFETILENIQQKTEVKTPVATSTPNVFVVTPQTRQATPSLR